MQLQFFFYLFMFSFYRNGIWNHVRLDKKEDFAVPGMSDIYAHKILIYARKKDVKYTAISSKWVLIGIFGFYTPCLR